MILTVGFGPMIEHELQGFLDTSVRGEEFSSQKLDSIGLGWSNGIFFHTLFLT